MYPPHLAYSAEKASSRFFHSIILFWWILNKQNLCAAVGGAPHPGEAAQGSAGQRAPANTLHRGNVQLPRSKPSDAASAEQESRDEAPSALAGGPDYPGRAKAGVEGAKRKFRSLAPLSHELPAVETAHWKWLCRRGKALPPNGKPAEAARSAEKRSRRGPTLGTATVPAASRGRTQAAKQATQKPAWQRPTQPAEGDVAVHTTAQPQPNAASIRHVFDSVSQGDVPCSRAASISLKMAKTAAEELLSREEAIGCAEDLQIHLDLSIESGCDSDLPNAKRAQEQTPPEPPLTGEHRSFAEQAAEAAEQHGPVQAQMLSAVIVREGPAEASAAIGRAFDSGENQAGPKEPMQHEQAASGPFLKAQLTTEGARRKRLVPADNSCIRKWFPDAFQRGSEDDSEAAPRKENRSNRSELGKVKDAAGWEIGSNCVEAAGRGSRVHMKPKEAGGSDERGAAEAARAAARQLPGVQDAPRQAAGVACTPRDPWWRRRGPGPDQAAGDNGIPRNPPGCGGLGLDLAEPQKKNPIAENRAAGGWGPADMAPPGAHASSGPAADAQAWGGWLEELPTMRDALPLAEQAHSSAWCSPVKHVEDSLNAAAIGNAARQTTDVNKRHAAEARLEQPQCRRDQPGSRECSALDKEPAVESAIGATKAAAAHQQSAGDPANQTGEHRVIQGLAEGPAAPTASQAAAAQLPLADVLQSQGGDLRGEYISELQANNRRLREELAQKKQLLQLADRAAFTAQSCQKAAELAAQLAKEDCRSTQLALHQTQKDKVAAVLARLEAQMERQEAQEATQAALRSQRDAQVAAGIAQESQRQAELAAELMQEKLAAAELATKQQQQQQQILVNALIADIEPTNKTRNGLQLIAAEYSSSNST